jgi:hypothetical protein
MAMTLAASTAPEVTAFMEIGKRIGQIYNEASSINARMQGVVDRAFGPAPEASGSTGQPRAVSSGEVAQVLQSLDDLGGILARNAVLMTRIDGII